MTTSRRMLPIVFLERVKVILWFSPTNLYSLFTNVGENYVLNSALTVFKTLFARIRLQTYEGQTARVFSRASRTMMRSAGISGRILLSNDYTIVKLQTYALIDRLKPSGFPLMPRFPANQERSMGA